MKRMLEKELARYKAGMNAAQAMRFALMLVEADKVLAANGTRERADINRLWRNITEADDRLAGAYAALSELNYKVPETDANYKRMELSARRYRLLAEKLS